MQSSIVDDRVGSVQTNPDLLFSELDKHISKVSPILQSSVGEQKETI